MITLKDKFSYFLPGTNGKGVLLIHGLTGAPAEMKFVARALNRAGFSIYAPLLAGHGVDKKTLIATNWQDWLESVIQSAQQLKHEVETVYAAGICVGGKLGMLAAHQEPNLIEATAIYSPTFVYDGWNVPFYYPYFRYLGWLSHFPLLSRVSFPETNTLGIKDERLRRIMDAAPKEGIIDQFPARALVEQYRLNNALRKQLPSIKTPTLILHAEEDDLSNPRNAHIIANNIGAPHKLVWINDSYHMIHVDAQHKQVAQLTADFFRETQHG